MSRSFVVAWTRGTVVHPRPVGCSGAWWAPEYGVETFPFLAECAPYLVQNFAADWARWRGRRPNPELDALAAGPLLTPDEIVAALKPVTPRVNGSARRPPFQEAETEQEAAADA
jgi:hypothetical protein